MPTLTATLRTLRLTATLAAALLCMAVLGGEPLAQRLTGDAAKAARERVRDIKKGWSGWAKSEKLPLLTELSRLPEKSVADFLLEIVAKEADTDTASEAARALTCHSEKPDIRALLAAFNAAKEPARKRACLRWLGAYGDDAPSSELLQVALGADPWGEAAVLALDETRSAKAREWLEKIVSDSKSQDSRRAACERLLAHGETSGARGLSSLDGLERAARAAQAAIGSPLETEALERVLEFAKRPQRFAPGVRPHEFGSFLGRLQKPQSHQKVVDEAAKINKAVEVEVNWWLIGWCNAPTVLKIARAGLEDDDRDRVISGLRYLQRAPEPLKGEDLLEAAKLLAPHLAKGDDEDVLAHALLACAACGVITDTVEGMMTNWLKDAKRPQRRAAALLAMAVGKVGGRNAEILAALKDESWYVVSAALEALRRLRPATGLFAVLELAKKEQGGRIWAEAITLLCDLTGQDFGDDLAKWQEWLDKNVEGFKPAPSKRSTLRGVPVTRLKAKTSARFFGIEFESENVEFTLDRSISMVDPVRREPQRPDYAARKADILKRRPEVKRLVRDGFLPRFHVACIELSGCLENKEQRLRFGITLFNTDLETYKDKRTPNGTAERRAAAGWMMSTEVKGGTDILNALLAVIGKAEADTILLLSDGEPLSLGIIEQLQRANTFKRVDIHVVNLARDSFARNYLDVIARGAAGMLVDAEPMGSGQ